LSGLGPVIWRADAQTRRLSRTPAPRQRGFGPYGLRV
jgi:hypothetical protein